MKKLVCPQCGSNELELFGASAYKCESCGTILKEESKIQDSKKEKLFRSKRIQRAFEDEVSVSNDFSEDHHEAGGQFIKLIFWIGVMSAVGGLVVWLFL